MLLQNLNLSRNVALRTLETTAISISVAEEKGDGTASRFFRTVLSSIAPSAPLDFVIIYWESDLGGCLDCYLCKPKTVCFRHPPHSERTGRDQQIRLVREMHSVRDFRLVLCADFLDYTVGDPMGALERIAEEVDEGWGHLLHEPLIIAERRVRRTHRSSGKLELSSGRGFISDASAL